MKERMSQEAYVYVILASTAVPNHQVNSDRQPDTTEGNSLIELSRGTRWLWNCVPDLTRTKLSLRSDKLPNYNRRIRYSAQSDIFNLWLIVKVVGTIVWWRHRVIPRVNALIQQEWHIN